MNKEPLGAKAMSNCHWIFKTGKNKGKRCGRVRCQTHIKTESALEYGKSAKEYNDWRLAMTSLSEELIDESKVNGEYVKSQDKKLRKKVVEEAIQEHKLRTIDDGVFPLYVPIGDKFDGNNYKETIYKEACRSFFKYDVNMEKKEFYKMYRVLKICLKKYKTGDDVDNLICSYATFISYWR